MKRAGGRSASLIALVALAGSGCLAFHQGAMKGEPPDATYLAWLDCTRLGLGDDPAEVFERAGRVAVNPGPAFGEPGRGHVRVNLATHPELLAEGVRRMARAVRSR